MLTVLESYQFTTDLLSDVKHVRFSRLTSVFLKSVTFSGSQSPSNWKGSFWAQAAYDKLLACSPQSNEFDAARRWDMLAIQSFLLWFAFFFRFQWLALQKRYPEWNAAFWLFGFLGLTSFPHPIQGLPQSAKRCPRKMPDKYPISMLTIHTSILFGFRISSLSSKW